MLSFARDLTIETYTFTSLFVFLFVLYVCSCAIVFAFGLCAYAWSYASLQKKLDNQKTSAERRGPKVSKIP